VTEFIFDAQMDPRIASKALSLYLKGQYTQAIVELVELLDGDGKNWQARILLAACYYKTGQFDAAQRGFRFLCENCPELNLKQKAFEAMQASHVSMLLPVKVPAEFGLHVDHKLAMKQSSWLDSYEWLRQESKSGMSARSRDPEHNSNSANGNVAQKPSTQGWKFSSR
jgi:tetratricopeptide (TPR) repeat protein